MNDMLYLVINFLPPSEDEGRTCWVATCPEIDLATQGDTYQEAENNIKEAIDAWIWACKVHGTLDAALAECGVPLHRREGIKNYAASMLHQQKKEKACHA